MAGDFGPIITGEDVRLAVENHIGKWHDTYLSAIERHMNLEPKTMPRYRSYESATDFDHWPEDQLPACLVISPGLLSAPFTGGDGRQMAEWSVGVVSIVSGQDRDGSIRLATLYAASNRLMMGQQRSLGGFAEEVRWVDETYDDMGTDESRTMANSLVQFGVLVANVMDRKHGPRGEPPVDPYTPPGPSSRVEHVFVSVEREE